MKVNFIGVKKGEATSVAIIVAGRIEDLLARPDSLLGQQLLPLTPAAATHSDL